MWSLVGGYLRAEPPLAPSPFLVEGQRPSFLYETQSHRAAGRGQVLQIAEAPVCLDCSNIRGSLAGKEGTVYVPELACEMVFPEQGLQKVMDTEGPCYWHLKPYHIGPP